MQMTMVRLAFVCGVSALGFTPRADDRLTEIIQNVRANEELYRDIELRYRMDYDLLVDLGQQPDRTMKGIRLQSRSVLQKGLIYLKQDCKESTGDGKSQQVNTHQGYDGKFLRLVEQDAIANIREDRLEDPRLVRPHAFMLFDSAGIGPSLADYLTGGKVARRIGGYDNAEITVSYDGDEVVEGLHCHRLKILYKLDGWKDDRGPNVRFLWLAPERNYMPVRTEAHGERPFDPKMWPGEIGQAEDFREIAPGVWLPYRVTSATNDLRTYLKEKKKQVQNQWSYTIEEAKLDPQYDVSLFRDIPIPDGMVVYEIANGKTLRKYTKGGVNVIRPRSYSTRMIVLLAAGVLVVLSAGVLLLRKRARRSVPLRNLAVS